MYSLVIKTTTGIKLSYGRSIPEIDLNLQHLKDNFKKKGELIMLHLALITDLHHDSEQFTTKEEKKIQEDFFANYFERFFSWEKIDRYVCLGDIANHGSKQEHEEMYKHIRQYKVPFWHVLGNHDSHNLTKDELLKLTEKERYGYEVTEEGVLVYLDTTRNSREDWSGEIDEEQVKWIKQLLTQFSTKNFFIFGHHPFANTTAGSHEYGGQITEDYGLYTLLQEHKPGGIYFNGHCHKHSIVKKGKWYFVQTASMLFDPTIRLITVDKGKVSIEMSHVQNDLFTQQADFIRGKVFNVIEDYDPVGPLNNRTLSFIF